MKRILLFGGLLVGTALVAPDALAQCAMCKAAVTSSEEGARFAPALNRAILLMMAAPYLTAATVAGVLYRRRVGSALARLAARARSR